MKAEQVTTERRPAFKPVEIKFTFETQDELDAMGSLFNHTAVLRAIKNPAGDFDPPYLYDVFSKAGADIFKYLPAICAELKDWVSTQTKN